MLTFDSILQKFGPAKRTGNEYRVRCPVHGDSVPSLDISQGDTAIVFRCRSAGCQTADILRAVGLTWGDVSASDTGHAREWDAIHEYRLANGHKEYETCRRGSGPSKVIRQRRADGQWTLKGCTLVPYRLPELAGQSRVFIVEGEKCADRLWSIGLPATCNVGGAKKWRASDTAALKAAGVTQAVILPDNDVEGLAHAGLVSDSLAASGVTVRALRLDGLSQKGDIADWLDAGHTRSELEALESAPSVRATPDSSTWGFSASKSGIRASNLSNVSVALGHDPTLSSLAWYDGFLDRLLTAGPRDWRDDDNTQLAIYLQEEHRLEKVSAGMVQEVVFHRARQAARHCVRDWLTSLTWDQVPRVATALAVYWGAPETVQQPREYLEAAGRNFLISLIARVRRPGCKVDTMPVFEGPQGIFKSSALEVLGDPWHIVSHESVTNKDFFQVLRGAWIVELSELDTITRAEVTRVKSVISTRVDRYRRSYGHNAEDHPRQCVFAGTTNVDNWGRDDTGLRRFWPVTCGHIDLDALRRDRDQLFAEATVLFDAGASWWEMPVSTSEVQATRQQESAWAEIILPWLAVPGRDVVTTTEILRDALKIEPSKMTKAAQMEVGSVLKCAGWDRRQEWHEGRNRKVWFLPNTVDDAQF